MKKKRSIHFELPLLVLSLLITLPVGAQTWQSAAKVTIPVVSINAACNSSSDTVGITADRSTLLSCQSGQWKKTQTQTLNPIVSIFASAAMKSVFTNHIVCTRTSVGDSIVFTAERFTQAGSIEYVGGSYGVHDFNPSTGAYVSGTSGYDCSGSSFQQIAAQGRAFN